jgi:predicted nuclease of predicted toxin-antitoxin system
VDEIRFFADQHYPAAVTEGLIRRGIDVVTAKSAGRCGVDDAAQLLYATAQDRVMLTFDSDFLDLDQRGAAHAGIVWCPATKYGVGELVRLLVLLHSVLSGSEMAGHVEYL